MKLCPILGSVFALCAVNAGAAEPAAPPKAAERCEAAVSDTITLMRGKQVREIQFTAAKRSLTPTGAVSQVPTPVCIHFVAAG